MQLQGPLQWQGTHIGSNANYLTNAGWNGPPTWNWRLTRIWRSTEGQVRSGNTFYLTIRIEGHTLGVTVGKRLSHPNRSFSDESSRNHICNTAMSRILIHWIFGQKATKDHTVRTALFWSCRFTWSTQQLWYNAAPVFAPICFAKSCQTSLHDLERGFKTVGWFKSYWSRVFAMSCISPIGYGLRRCQCIYHKFHFLTGARRSAQQSDRNIRIKSR